MQPDLRAHPRKIKQAAGLFVTAFDSFDFHMAGLKLSRTIRLRSRVVGALQKGELSF
jgi:hypothetical protein